MIKPTKQTFHMIFAELNLAPGGDGSRRASLTVEPRQGYSQTDAGAIRLLVSDLRFCASRLEELAQQMEDDR